MENKQPITTEEWIEKYIKRWGTPLHPFVDQDVHQQRIKYIKGSTVLDVCCGLGHLYYYLQKLPIQYTGIDCNKIVLNKAKTYFPQVSFIEGDIMDLSKMPKADTVTCLRILGHNELEKLNLTKAIHQLWHRTKKRMILTGSMRISTTVIERMKIINTTLRHLPDIEKMENFTTNYSSKGYKEDFKIFIIDKKQKESFLDLGCGIRPQNLLPRTTHCLDYSCGDKHRLTLMKNIMQKADKQYIDWDMNKLPLPFENGFFARIQMKHALEHFNIHHGERLIKECCRILRPHGRLFVEVPDMEYLAHSIVKNPDLTQKPEGCGWSMLDFLYGSYEVIQCKCCKKDLGLHIHKCGYTFTTLKHLLAKSGFKIIERKQRLIDLRVESEKI